VLKGLGFWGLEGTWELFDEWFLWDGRLVMTGKTDLKKSVAQIRDQSKEIATDNRVLKEQIRLTSTRSVRQEASNVEYRALGAQDLEKLTIEMKADAEERKGQQRERRRAIVNEIRQLESENAKLETDIRMLGGELSRLKRMSDSLPVAPQQRTRAPASGKKKGRGRAK
jgi:chromosome segregation ATPase